MMKKYYILLFFAFLYMMSSAQDIETIKEHKISQRVESVVNYKDGLLAKRVMTKQVFDVNGNLIELKDWTKDGKLKEWVKFTYNDAADVLTEEYLNIKGKVEERVVYEYQQGLKVKKSYFDSKERLVREKFYEYEYHK